MGERRDSTKPRQIIAKESDPLGCTRLSQIKFSLTLSYQRTRSVLFPERKYVKELGKHHERQAGQFRVLISV